MGGAQKVYRQHVGSLWAGPWKFMGGGILKFMGGIVGGHFEVYGRTHFEVYGRPSVEHFEVYGRRFGTLWAEVWTWRRLGSL